MQKSKLNKAELKEQYNIEMWTDDKIQAFRETLLNWYDQEKRDLPWRRTSDPYKIWISEIMLQQTRVDTVIPYFERFVKTFPTVQDLAEADDDKLLKVWEGLGYYSRVRNMKQAAIQVVSEYNGTFPSELEEIRKLKGIGPYTAGAISSIAFGHIEPAVDGNLMRVLSRLFEIEVDIAKPASRSVFEAVMYHLLDPSRPGDFNQALMDLGATICTPKNYFPENSPVKDFNASYVNETYLKYPIKSKKKKKKTVNYFAVAIQNDKGEYLLEKRTEQKLLSNMWTFPLLEETVLETSLNWKSFQKPDLYSIDPSDLNILQKYLQASFGIEAEINAQSKGMVSHVFTHLHWNVYLYKTTVKNDAEMIPANCNWVSEEEFDDYVFPVMQQKLCKLLKEVTLF